MSTTTQLNQSKQTIAEAAREIRGQWSPAERAKRSQVAQARQLLLLRLVSQSTAVA